MHIKKMVLAAVFVCVTKNAQTNCQCVSSQFIASKTQETHSRGNTVVFLSPKIDFVLASSASTDEKPRYAAFNLASHCLPK